MPEDKQFKSIDKAGVGDWVLITAIDDGYARVQARVIEKYPNGFICIEVDMPGSPMHGSRVMLERLADSGPVN
jgi:hypothetical protein